MAKRKKLFRIVWIILVSLVALATIVSLIAPGMSWF
jgi:preprotein translocase subunit SecE